ncbi:peptidoglycan-binding protein [Oceanobacillus iheyensis]|uniref:peptidoglycan-binding domain-containing protein n=1 Tax=Oceanobacillus iheyensis TaxID=182710 RepID=UPI0036293A65
MKKKWLTIVPAVALAITPLYFQEVEASSDHPDSQMEQSNSDVPQRLQPILDIAPEHQPTLKEDSVGLEVELVQVKLNHFGFETDVDGIFGSKTEKQVMNFQKKHDLIIDGIVGEETWTALLAEECQDMFTVDYAISLAEEELNNDDLIFSSNGELYVDNDGRTFYNLKASSKSMIEDGGTGTVGFYNVYSDGEVILSEPMNK